MNGGPVVSALVAATSLLSRQTVSTTRWHVQALSGMPARGVCKGLCCAVMYCFGDCVTVSPCARFVAHRASLLLTTRSVVAGRNQMQRQYNWQQRCCTPLLCSTGSRCGRRCKTCRPCRHLLFSRTSMQCSYRCGGCCVCCACTDSGVGCGTV